MRIPVLFKSAHATAERQVLIDSGATDNFICSSLLKRLQISTRDVTHPIRIWNVDGTHNQDGAITQYTDLTVRTGEKERTLRFLVTNLGRDEVILGYPWFTAFEPVIRWGEATLNEEHQPVVISSLHLSDEATPMEASIRALETYELDEEAWEQLMDEEQEPQITFLRKTTTASELAQREAATKQERTFEEMIPEEYRRHRKIFDEEASHRFPPSRIWDHAIDLLPDAPAALDCKIYPLAQNEEEALTTFLTEQQEKGYIRPSKSPYASPFFFIKKKDGKLRPVQDYRRLNALTVRNHYPLPLIPELIDRIRGARLYSKLDIKWGYNNVRVKEGDEWKAAFKTNRGLYEPLVMYFGLTNSPSTFQAMMDHTLKGPILTGEVIVYMDDILVATANDLAHHRTVLHEVLRLCEESDLYIKPEKCEFEVLEIEYLGLIIGHGNIRMDPVKVRGIQEWRAPRSLREVRAFLGFCNFYRRFIRGFSALARPLHNLTRKDTPWQWGQTEQDAFDNIRRCIGREPTLLFPDLTKPFELEVDASNVALGAVLNQLGPDQKLHPIAFHSESLSQAERNYDIYDRELLAVVKALRAWRTYLVGSPHKIIIHTDHANLQYWKEPRKISRRVAREFLELSEYDFLLKHVSGVKNSRADALSRRADHEADAEDNNDVVVLPADRFIRATEMSMHDMDIWTQISQNLDEKDVLRWVEPHNLKKLNGLWWKNDALVVVGDNDLKRGVITFFHDTPAMGHPGIANTYELLRRDYWWPNMRKDVEDYVKGCATCQANKINTHRQKPHLFPISTDPDAEPFEVVTMDFITKLPPSQGYDSILTITDHDCSKAAIFIPCNESITAEGVARLYLRHVYPHYGIPRKLITDRDPRFTSAFMKQLCSVLGIRQNISSAYHPQTDGQSERTNQWLEQYLRHWSNVQQDNWAEALPVAQFAHNAWPNATTKHSPFSLIMGWEPRTMWTQKPTSTPSVDQRLEEMAIRRQHAQDCIKHAQELMAKRGKTRFIPYQEGAQVWLEGTNLRTFYPTAKLAPKRHGPFRIKKALSAVSYELELPSTWKIHPVFHANLLTPYKETELHGTNFTRPPPDLIDGEEEFEVEQILGSRLHGRGRKLQFLVQWKGFPMSDSTWEPLGNVQHAPNLIADFYRHNPTADGAGRKV